jgi:hypothetical protein
LSRIHLELTTHSGIYAEVTFNVSPTILTKVFNLYNATIAQVESVKGLTYTMVLQSLPAYVPGNSLGLSGPTGSNDPSRKSIICLLTHFWADESDTPKVTDVTQNLIQQIQDAADSEGVLVRFEYLNYAASFQDPLGSYGAKSKANLEAVSYKYDPKRIFQKRVPGNFKL